MMSTHYVYVLADDGWFQPEESFPDFETALSFASAEVGVPWVLIDGHRKLRVIGGPDGCHHIDQLLEQERD